MNSSERHRLGQLRKLAQERPEYFYYQLMKMESQVHGNRHDNQDGEEATEEVYQVPRQRVKPLKIGHSV